MYLIIHAGKRLCALLIATLLMIAAVAHAAEPTLELDVSRPALHLGRDTLLANPAVRTITLYDDPAYHRGRQYRALPLSGIDNRKSLAQIGQRAIIMAIDGLCVRQHSGRQFALAGPGQAWLAIEPADADPWPALKPNVAGSPSAGSFYLVWLTPGKTGISPEQWPYQIAKIAMARRRSKSATRKYCPKPCGTNSSEQRGLRVYAANCATCHQIDGAGDAAIGPDLNLPFSPTEYFQERYFRKIDPQIRRQCAIGVRGSCRDFPPRY